MQNPGEHTCYTNDFHLAIELKCKNGTKILADHNTNFGTWRTWLTCPPGKAVMGFKTRVETWAHDRDDARLICFKY